MLKSPCIENGNMGLLAMADEIKELKTLKVGADIHYRVRKQVAEEDTTMQEWVERVLLAALPKLNAKVRQGGK